MALQQEKNYTIEDIYALPDGKRAELIDGRIYDMAPPSTKHQLLISKLNQKIANYIDEKGGNCMVLPAPFAVFLNEDDRNYVEPDISVICDKGRLDDKGCKGAPDWIIEVVSPSSTRMAYFVKLFKYRTAGVREYWIVNPMKKAIQTYIFEGEEDSNLFSFDDEIVVYIFDGLTIRISDLLGTGHF